MSKEITINSYLGKTLYTKNKYCDDDIFVRVDPSLVPTDTIAITRNGSFDVVNYATANVNVTGGGDPVVIQELNVNANGTYNVPEGVTGYNPVVVNVESGAVLETKVITANGTYTPSEGYNGFSSVVVNVPAVEEELTEYEKWVRICGWFSRINICVDPVATYNTGAVTTDTINSIWEGQATINSKIDDIYDFIKIGVSTSGFDMLNSHIVGLGGLLQNISTDLIKQIEGVYELTGTGDRYISSGEYYLFQVRFAIFGDETLTIYFDTFMFVKKGD